jgi:hypothetical protein
MDQLINSLSAVLAAAGATEEIRQTAALAAWNHVAGEAVSQQTAPLGLRENRLVIAVKDFIWRRQLESIGGQLLFRLNSLLGQDVVRFIEFHVNPQAVQSANARRQPLRNRPPAPDRERVIPFELVTAAATIQNSRLRKAFLGAAMSCAKRMEEGEPGNAD